MGRPNPATSNPKTSSYHGKFTNTNTLRIMLQGKNPRLLRCAKAQEKLNDLSKMAPRLKIPEVPRLLLSLLLQPREHTALLPSQGITVCLASHTQRGFVRQNVCQRDREPIVG